MLKTIVVNTLKQNHTRAFRSQPMSKDYSTTKWADNFSIATQMQLAFINAIIKGE